MAGRTSSTDTESQVSINVNLRASTDERLTQKCRQRRLVKKHVISDWLEWYVDLDETMASFFGGGIEARDMPQVAKMLLERAASGDIGWLMRNYSAADQGPAKPSPVRTRSAGTNVPRRSRGQPPESEQ